MVQGWEAARSRGANANRDDTDTVSSPGIHACGDPAGGDGKPLVMG